MKLRDVPFPIDGMDIKHAMFVIEYLKTFKASVAAESLGYTPDHGYTLLKRPDVELAINLSLRKRYEDAQIDASWLLSELVDNHYLARQMGNLQASNAALNTIAKHAAVDAFAAEKFEFAGDEDKVARLLRGRKRAREQQGNDADEISFL